MDLKNIKIPKRKKTWRKGGIHRDPEAYWYAGLIIALALIFGGGFFGYYLFQNVSQELSGVGVSDKATVSLDKAGLKNALDYYHERETKSENIINSPASVVDPSL